MLRRLFIEDYLLVRHTELEFSPGLTVLTGETGAGKSMILGALDVLLGSPVPRDAIRHGSERAVLEAEFSLQPAEAIRESVGRELDDNDDSLLLRREISLQGRSRYYLNDRPLPREFLAKLRALLVDFHGQREHQDLFLPARQLEYLDAFAGLRAETENVSALHALRSVRLRELSVLQEELGRHRKDQALLSYQLEEIERLGLKPGEETEITDRLNRLENAKKLAGETARLADLLSEGDESLLVQAGRARGVLAGLCKTDSSLKPLADETHDLEERIRDLSTRVRDYADQLSFDDAELAALRERRSVLWELKRKHGMDVSEILARAGELKSLLERGENLAAEVERLLTSLADVEMNFVEAARRLSRERRKSAPAFSAKVLGALRPLGFSNAVFEARLNPEPESLSADRIGRDGADVLEFLFSANPGAPAVPLAQVASGGESSRITLAIRSVLADVLSYPVMVYDEIDLGISGRVADQVGKALSALSGNHQVIVITHLPQIASQADQHLAVMKSMAKGATVTEARFLDPSERVAAVAALMAGANVTEKTLASADELLKQAGKPIKPIKKVG